MAARAFFTTIIDALDSPVEKELVDDLEPELLEVLVVGRPFNRHRLKGFDSPERLYQLVVDGLSDDFPPPRTAEVGKAHVPARMTSFIG